MPLEKLGPYRLEKMLGRGGMGAVYAGVNETTGERAAVKVLAAHLADNVDFRERFASEVETLKKLKHPNIVQLFAYGQEGENLFYVMQLIDGRSLQEELHGGRRFEWRETARIGVDICKALKHAHDNGVIHRDLKPANLLIDPTESIKLTDFGIAKLYGGTQITAAGGILGTADYMAPEQAEGKPVTVRSDLYSLGSVLYALLTGRPPFSAKTLAEVIHGLRFEKPIAVRRLAPDTPAEFESIILQLLEKDPAKRIPSAFAVSNFLRAMEHALSMETRVGSIDIPAPENPATPSTKLGRSGVDLTVATNGPSSNPNGVTIELGTGVERVSSASRVVLDGAQGPSSVIDSKLIHHQPTAIAQVEQETAAPVSKFITVEEEEASRKQESSFEEEGAPVWLVVTGLILVTGLLSGVLWYSLKPPSADTLFARIEQAAATQSIVNVEPDLLRFLELYPTDARVEKLREYEEDIELTRLERKFELQIRRIGDVDSLSPVETAYLEAARSAATDPLGALARFQALIDVFGGDDENATAAMRKTRKLCVTLARKQVASLQEAGAVVRQEHRDFLKRRLEQAAAIAQEYPEEAQAIRRGIIELYRDRPWLDDLINQAREELEAAEKSSSTSP